MGAQSRSYPAEARTDAEDRLLTADEPLASLQIRCGGRIPGTVAVPELLALVRKCRTYGFAIARTMNATDGEDRISAWVEIAPDKENAGCIIRVVSWMAVPLPVPDDAEDSKRRHEIGRNTADFVALLDVNQQILVATSHVPELRVLETQMNDAVGKRWTQFVKLADAAQAEPLHWRLLDGARCSVRDSGKIWQVTLIPTDTNSDRNAGFELILTIDPGIKALSSNDEADKTSTLLIGGNFGPVLRQPIARVIANAETIRMKLAGPLADEYSNYAADISNAAQHLLSLIEDLSDLEVVDAEGFTTAPDIVDLADCARRTVGILGVKAQDKNIALRAPEESVEWLAIGEFRRVLQILLNLVGNAINYSPAGSTVTVALSGNDNAPAISVIDEGPGLLPEQAKQAFTKFERLGRGGDEGSGLGLYISRKLADAMGGTLCVQSAAGEGAAFTLTLPPVAD